MSLLGGAVVASPPVARAQQPALPVIGLLDPRRRHLRGPSARISRSLKDTGYIEGENVAISYRWAENEWIDCPIWRPIWFAARSP